MDSGSKKSLPFIIDWFWNKQLYRNKRTKMNDKRKKTYWSRKNPLKRTLAHARTSTLLNPHYNQPSNHWPCVKFCLVGSRDKSNPLKITTPKQLQTHNMPTYEVENVHGKNKRGDLQHVNKPWTVPRGTEMMQRVDQRHMWSTVHWLTQPQREPDMSRKFSYGMDWQQKRIINCLKMYKISGEVINLIEKHMETWRGELTVGGKS